MVKIKEVYIIKPNLCSLWKIGKNVHNNREKYNNVVEKYSDYFSYYFGNSYLFTRDNIHLMERFYLNFPIYYDKLNNISWEQYKLLLKIKDKKERFFYFYLSLFFNSNLDETNEFINNNYYVRI